MSDAPRISIWWMAFGYFACYAPYSALTKALSRGVLPGMSEAIDGPALLPSTAMASMVGMFLFLTAMRWWKHAGHRTILGRQVPLPSIWTFGSGLFTGAIVVTTTMAYTFDGVSIVFVMLLMRGGVLVIAPIVDAVSKRKVRWFSWTGLGLSLAALVVAFAEEGGYDITLACAIDVAIYLVSYFVRLRLMSRLAKQAGAKASVRFFVEEQMTATPAVVVALALFAWLGAGTVAEQLRAGFFEIWSSPVLWVVLLVGVLSQGTGVFGGLILLDNRENTYCVPVNRSSSILAGVVASFALALLLGLRAPSGFELAGAGLIVLAIVMLTVPPLLEKRRPRIG